MLYTDILVFLKVYCIVLGGPFPAVYASVHKPAPWPYDFQDIENIRVREFDEQNQLENTKYPFFSPRKL